MTDNFDRYIDFIRMIGDFPEDTEGNLPDKYYVVELVRRGKDNKDLPAANYHFKNYYIYSINHLNKYKQEIIDICNLLKLRAYCSVNYKLMSQVALDTIAECTRRIAMHDCRRFYSIFESASGKFVDRGNSLWIVDVDDVTEDSTIEALEALIDNMKSGYNKNVIYKMPTKSGIHLITHPFNLQQFNLEWNNNLLSVDIKKNHLTLLYENL